MAHPTAVLNVVALSEGLLPHAPRLAALAEAGCLRRLQPVLPAVTCSVQASMLTGEPPREHGIVGNGWYHRDTAEVRFWLQSNRLVQREPVWETARRRDPAVTCCNMFWWFNMYSSADGSVTPRPMYPADGRKIPDVYTEPPELRGDLQQRLGRFPLFSFWGPAASIRASEWIAAAARHVHERHRPTLQLVYLPHLDYGLQKLGPDHAEIPRHVAAVDAVAGELIDYYRDRGVRVIVLSEYGIEPVTEAIPINTALRRAGFVRVRGELGRDLLDAGASRAFAVADHQVAHVYVRDPADRPAVADACRDLPGVEQVLEGRGLSSYALDHERAGDLVAVAEPGRWFSYGWWLEPGRAPDYARTVDIHRKPGYDPCELFLDPALRLPKLRIAWKLARRKLGFRTLLDVIPLDTSLVRGSHGRVHVEPAHRPVLITERGASDPLPCTAVRDVILQHVLDGEADVSGGGDPAGPGPGSAP